MKTIAIKPFLQTALTIIVFPGMTDELVKEKHLLNLLEQLPPARKSTTLFLIDHLRRYSTIQSIVVRSSCCKNTVFLPISFLLVNLSPGQTRKHCDGNICDSRCFLKCFPVCPPVETLLRKQNLLPEKQKCFLANSETFDVSLCFSLMFPSVCPLWETWRNIGRKQCFRNNVS